MFECGNCGTPKKLYKVPDKPIMYHLCHTCKIYRFEDEMFLLFILKDLGMTPEYAKSIYEETMPEGYRSI